MSHDALISLLMEKTFEAENDVTRPSGLPRDEEFRLRRGLASQPVRAFEGEWCMPGLARFTLAGQALDVPMNHAPVAGWSTADGRVTTQPAFVHACSQLLGDAFTHALVIQSAGEKPWLVFWNHEEHPLEASRLQALFQRAAVFGQKKAS